jgi:hypothetical protein
MKLTCGLAVLVLELGCVSTTEPKPPIQSSGSGSGSAAPLPSVCSWNVSTWAPRSGAFVPASVARRALLPAMVGLQRRLCDCAARVTSLPPELVVVFDAKPNLGRTEVKAKQADELASCVGAFDAVYPPFPFGGDLLDCDAGGRCTSPPASFVYPLHVTLADRAT